jgi:hypothetical protein
MAKHARVNGRVVAIYGPFKGSEDNHGRKHYTYYDSETGKRGSVNAARIEVQEKTGKEVPKGKDVDHKDGHSTNDSSSNLRVESKSKNIADGNKDRKKTKYKHHRKKK